MTRNLNLVIDGRPLVGKRTGIGVHTAEIASRLPFSPPPLIASHKEIEDRSAIERCRFREDFRRPGVLWQQQILARVAREERADVLWGPHGTLPLNLKVPAVITIHDLTSLTMPLRHRLRTIASFNLLIGRSIAMAASIACVSSDTADAVSRGFGVDRRNITIVPNGVDPFFSPGEESEMVMPFGLERESYLLYVGTLEPRKGINDLITAWEQLPAARPRLVLCGELGWGNVELLRRIEHHPARADIIVSGYLDRRSLRELYRRAALFVYPSHYEGFGLPPLEAMACGTPVLTTRAGAIPEVVSDAAVVVGAKRPDELFEAITALLADRKRRDELSLLGLERAAGFSWDRSADAMVAAIERATR